MKIFQIHRILLAVLIVLLTGCAQSSGSIKVQDEIGSSTTENPIAADTATPFQPLPTSTVTPTPTIPPEILVWLPDWLPEGINSHLIIEYPFVRTAQVKDAMVGLKQPTEGNPDYSWVYALVAPFPTITDGITSEEIISNWRGASTSSLKILVDRSTYGVFTEKWGIPATEFVQVIDSSELINAAWSEKETWAIVPFEQVSPRWKVIRIDGHSPFDRNLNLSDYPLTINLAWEALSPEGSVHSIALQKVNIPTTNRDEAKLTRVLLTGTTALVRSTAERMETLGLDYPSEDILPWLLDADFTHISNEISFYDQCPPAVPVRLGTRFCSNPDYIELLDMIDVDIIELTGNHLIDFGREALSATLAMYQEHGYLTFGGGANYEEAIRPLIIEHNENRIAFLGCNRAGPENVWATDERPGAAPCDLDLMSTQVQSLLAEGILPVVTFQHFELEDFMPINLARQEMQRMAETGAVVVSGSQAHFPHGFTFVGDNFVHYGLGNLFFDQMWPNHRREFIDRHIFYDGKYLGVELLTAMLEDYARPRPMTQLERADMLTRYFEVSGWQISDKE